MTTGVGLWLLDTGGRVFRFLGALQESSDEVAEPEEQWKLVSGLLKRLSATRECAWGLDTEDRPVVYVHSTYVPVRVAEEVYEAASRGLLGRGGAGHSRWTNSDGSEERATPEHTQLPSLNWEWERKWDIDKEHVDTDEEGWYYPRKGLRIRKWFRYRSYTSRDSFAVVPGIDPDNPRHDPFRDIAVGGTDLPGREDGSLCVWAVTLRDTVVFREGITRTTPEGTNWLKVATSQKSINQISVGPTGVVWAVTYDGSAIVRVGATRDRPSGIRWVHVPAPGPNHNSFCLTHCTVGMNVVWATSTGSKVWFRKGIKIAASDDSAKVSVEGTEWIEMVGEGEFISVGPDDQVYMVGAGKWPVHFRTGVRREELGGTGWVPLHGALGHTAYVENKEREQRSSSSHAPLEMDQEGVQRIRNQILRSKESFRRGARDAPLISVSSAPDPSLSSWSLESEGRSSPSLEPVIEDGSARQPQAYPPSELRSLTLRRNRSKEIREEHSGRPRTSSLPYPGQSTGAVAGDDFRGRPIGSAINARSRSFGFSPGMIAKAQAFRQSTHENAEPELAQWQKRDGAFFADGGDSLMKEETISRLESIVSAAMGGSNGSLPAQGACQDVLSQDMTSFVTTSATQQQSTADLSHPVKSNSIPCHADAEQLSRVPGEQASRDSPQLALKTASSSCQTTDSGIYINLAVTESGSHDPPAAKASVFVASKDSGETYAPCRTTQDERQKELTKSTEDSAFHVEAARSGRDGQAASRDAVSDPPPATKACEHVASDIVSHALTGGAHASPCINFSSSTLTDRPSDGAPVDEPDGAISHTDAGNDEDNVIVSKIPNDPRLVIDLKRRMTEVCEEGKSPSEVAGASIVRRQGSSDQVVLNVDNAATQSTPADTELMVDIVAASSPELAMLLDRTSSSLSPPSQPQQSADEVNNAAAGTFVDDPQSSLEMREERVQTIQAAHPVMSVHSWKWLSAGGCVPPHEDVTKPGAFLGSGLTAAVTLCRRAVTTKRRDSVQRKTGWRQNILRQLRDRNEREVLAFRDSIGASEGGVWSKRGHLTWCMIPVLSSAPYHFISVSVTLNRGSRHGGQLELLNTTTKMVERINLGDVSCLMPIPSDDIGQPNCFVVHTPQNLELGRYVALCCANERERDDWYTAISLAAIRSQGLDGPPAPNSLWALTQSGEVFISDPSKNPAMPHERRWRAIGGHLRSISAGACGVVWGIGFDGTPLAYNGGFGGGVFVQSVDASSSSLQEHTDSQWFHLSEVQQTKGVSWSSSVYEDELGRVQDKKQGILPSKAWQWSTEWTIDFTGADAEGWQRQVTRSRMSIKGPRRRIRKWKRKMTVITAGPWLEILPCPNRLASVSVQTWPQQPIGTHDNVAVWAMDVHGDVICRYGVTASQPQGEEWRWVSSNTKFTSLGVGSNRSIWGISDSGCAFIRLGITDIKQSGTSWKRVGVPVADRMLTDVAVGLNRVWVRDNRGELWFRAGITASLPEGQNWVKVSSNVDKLSLSSNNQLWMVYKGSICRLQGVTPESPCGAKEWEFAIQPCWHSISAGATDVSNLTTRTKAAGGDSDLNIIALSFEDLKAGFPLLVKGNNLFWCTAVFLQLDPDTDKIQVQMIHEGRNIRWFTRQNVTLDIPPPEACLSLNMKVLYKYNYVGDSYYKLGDLENLNHLDNSYKILSAVRNVARTKEDLRLPPEALALAQKKTVLDSEQKKLVSDAATRAAGKYKQLGSVRRRRAANISEEGKTGAVAMYTMLSSRESDVSLQQPSPTSSAASET